MASRNIARIIGIVGVIIFIIGLIYLILGIFIGISSNWDYSMALGYSMSFILGSILAFIGFVLILYYRKSITKEERREKREKRKKKWSKIFFLGDE